MKKILLIVGFILLAGCQNPTSTRKMCIEQCGSDLPAYNPGGMYVACLCIVDDEPLLTHERPDRQ